MARSRKPSAERFRASFHDPGGRWGFGDVLNEFLYSPRAFSPPQAGLRPAHGCNRPLCSFLIASSRFSPSAAQAIGACVSAAPKYHARPRWKRRFIIPKPCSTL